MLHGARSRRNAALPGAGATMRSVLCLQPRPSGSCEDHARIALRSSIYAALMRISSSPLHAIATPAMLDAITGSEQASKPLRPSPRRL